MPKVPSCRFSHRCGSADFLRRRFSPHSLSSRFPLFIPRLNLRRPSEPCPSNNSANYLSKLISLGILRKIPLPLLAGSLSARSAFNSVSNSRTASTPQSYSSALTAPSILSNAAPLIRPATLHAWPTAVRSRPASFIADHKPPLMPEILPEYCSTPRAVPRRSPFSQASSQTRHRASTLSHHSHWSASTGSLSLPA